MKDYELLDAMGGIDEKYIRRASEENVQKKPAPWRKWVAAAACLCLIAAGAFSLHLLNLHNQKNVINSEAHTIDPPEEKLIRGEELAELEKANGYMEYQVNASGQTFGSQEMIEIVRKREEEEFNQAYAAEHPEIIAELTEQVQRMKDTGVQEEFDWERIGCDYAIGWEYDSGGNVVNLGFTFAEDEGTLPDLVWWSYMDGEVMKYGYISKEDYLAFGMEERKNIPLYESDGKTLAGYCNFTMP